MKKIFILLFTILSISVSAQKAYKIMSKDIFEGMDSRQQTELEESFNKAVSQFKKVLSKNSDDVMATPS
jgi:TRAP-type C4-dicarboxylate transport system substrate-binding protein